MSPPQIRAGARAPLVVAAVVALVSGVLAGLVRAGWPWPIPATIVAGHGPLLAVGFFGTLIGLERAVAIGHPAALAWPALSATAGIAILASHPIAPLVGAAAGIAAVLAHAPMLVRRRSADLAMLALGTVALAVGSSAWAVGRPIAEASLGWSAFLVLTIVGERLELTRVLPPRRGRGPLLAIAVAALAAGSVVALVHPVAGAWVRGIALSGLGAWLLAFDAALRVRSAARYLRIALAIGHAWLLAAGPLTIAAAGAGGGLAYDAALHSVYAGFVLGMVLAHAPIVLPAVAKIDFGTPRALFAPLALLHSSVVARVAGDVARDGAIRQGAALATAAALVLFASIVIVSIATRRGPRGTVSLHPSTPQAR